MRLLAASDPSADGLPRSLANVEVLIDGEPAPLIYVSSTQINLASPSQLTPGEGTDA